MKKTTLLISILLWIFKSYGGEPIRDTISKISTIPNIENTMTNSTMPWIVALLIGILTIIINLLISNHQLRNSRKLLDIRVQAEKERTTLEIKKSVLSDNRQKWINELRDCVSEFIAIHTFLTSSNILAVYGEKENEQIKLKAKTLEHKIQLLLNPFEDDSIKLIESVSKLPNAYDIENENSDYQIFKDTSNEIVKLTQKILKTEWKRVKDLK